MNEQDQNEQVIDEDEALVVEDMKKAVAIVKDIFGDQATVQAALEVYDYLLESDEEAFVTDLRRCRDHAKSVFAVETPTTEQAFGVFKRVFPEPDDE